MLNNTTLGQLIAWLETQPPDMVVDDGFGSPHSDRGSYDELAFKPMEKARIGDMLSHAKSAVGATFWGYKGGEYKMDELTPVYIGVFGDCGTPITPIHFKYWSLAGEMSDKIEHCTLCGSPTGRCGDDSIHIEASDDVYIGPLCEECLNGIVHWVASDACISPNQQALAEKDAELAGANEQIRRMKCCVAEHKATIDGSSNQAIEMSKSLGCLKTTVSRLLYLRKQWITETIQNEISECWKKLERLSR